MKAKRTKEQVRRYRQDPYWSGVLLSPTFLCRRNRHCGELDRCRLKRDLRGEGLRMCVDGRWLSPRWAGRVLFSKTGARRFRGELRADRRASLEHRVHTRSGRYDDLPF